MTTKTTKRASKPNHDDDLKRAPSASSSSCNGQSRFDSSAVIGFHLGTVSVFYSPTAHVYSLRTWLLIARAGLAGQRGRYPLEMPGFFWHRLSVRNGLRSQTLHERFYMETPKANWPVEIRLIVSSAWLPVAMAAIWVPNHHRLLHLTKQRALFSAPSFKPSPRSALFLPFCLSLPLHLSCLWLYRRPGIPLLIHMDFAFN